MIRAHFARPAPYFARPGGYLAPGREPLDQRRRFDPKAVAGLGVAGDPHDVAAGEIGEYGVGRRFVAVEPDEQVAAAWAARPQLVPSLLGERIADDAVPQLTRNWPPLVA